MTDVLQLAFDDPDLGRDIASLDGAALDRLEFGVIGFDGDGVVRLYNSFESRCAGLSSGNVVGQPMFTIVAPCMNNYLVAQRFEDAAAAGTVLDATIDYVLTLRMRPVKVSLRLLASPDYAMRYVIVSGRPR
jgi:photoactive yellow protein